MSLRNRLTNGRRWLLALVVAAVVAVSAFGIQVWPSHAAESNTARSLPAALALVETRAAAAVDHEVMRTNSTKWG